MQITLHTTKSSRKITFAWWLFKASITEAGLVPVIVRLLFLALTLGSTRPTSLAMALAVSLLKMGEAMGLMLLSPEDIEEPFLPEGDSGGLELFSLDEPNNLSWALNALPGLSS